MQAGNFGLPATWQVEPLLRSWLMEDVGRGDQTTLGILGGDRYQERGEAVWVAKEAGVVAGLPLGMAVFRLLDPEMRGEMMAQEGQACQVGEVLLRLEGSHAALLTGERVALNLVMRLSGIATMTRCYVDCLEGLPCCLVDTRKTTPGLRVLEKYASRVGGAVNHRWGLDDAVMIKDNHIAAAGGILEAIEAVRRSMPYPLSIEVETETLDQVDLALAGRADIIMLDNMPLGMMREAVKRIRRLGVGIRIEGSGNVPLERVRSMGETGVDFISTSAPITRSSWLDVSMRMVV